MCEFPLNVPSSNYRKKPVCLLLPATPLGSAILLSAGDVSSSSWYILFSDTRGEQSLHLMRQRRTGWTGWGSFCLCFWFVVFFSFWSLTNLLPLFTEERDGKLLIDHPGQLLLSATWFPVLHFIFLLGKKIQGFALVPIWAYFIALFHPVTSTQGILNNFCPSFPFYLLDICRVLCFPPSHCVNIFSLNGIGRAVRPVYRYDCLSLLVIQSCFMLLSQTLIIWTEFLLYMNGLSLFPWGVLNSTGQPSLWLGLRGENLLQERKKYIPFSWEALTDTCLASHTWLLVSGEHNP